MLTNNYPFKKHSVFKYRISMIGGGGGGGAGDLSELNLLNNFQMIVHIKETTKGK